MNNLNKIINTFKGLEVNIQTKKKRIVEELMKNGMEKDFAEWVVSTVEEQVKKESIERESKRKRNSNVNSLSNLFKKSKVNNRPVKKRC